MGMEVKRKFDKNDKRIIYIFYGCKNCVNILNHCEITIVDFFKVMKEFEQYYFSDIDELNNLRMKMIEIEMDILGGEQGVRRTIHLSYYNMLIMYIENKDILFGNK